MVQLFGCSNLECKFETKGYGNMRMKELYEK